MWLWCPMYVNESSTSHKVVVHLDAMCFNYYKHSRYLGCYTNIKKRREIKEIFMFLNCFFHILKRHVAKTLKVFVIKENTLISRYPCLFSLLCVAFINFFRIDK